MQSRINRTFPVEFQLEPRAQLPWRKRNTDAGFDLFAFESAKLPQDKVVYVRTGVKMMPPDGYFFRVSPRSGVTKAGILVLDGTVDAGYTGEILVPMLNINETTYVVVQGDRIAQAIFAPILHPQFVQVEKFTEHGTDHRGARGFGSSGR
jgi:dUTP pyrophosphatase